MTVPRKAHGSAMFPADGHAPAFYEKADVVALQAVAAGTANEGQQKRALDWIINFAARTYDQPFRPGKDGQTEFACGRMFVGQEIVRALKLKPGQIKEQEHGRSTGSGEQPG